jgi:predicted TIM-barrel fold metal-dependent hydrolase
MIIDAQAHFMPPAVAEKTSFFKVGWSDLDRQLAVMDQNGIDRAVLLYPTSDAHLAMGGWAPLCQIYNREIAAVVKKFPQRFIGGGIIPVDKPEAIPQELERIQELGLNVISLASSYDGRYLDDERFLLVYEFARESKMPIHVHPQIIGPIGEERVRDPLLSPVLEYVMDVSMCIGKLLMSGVFLKYPDVNFIFAHYGGVLPMLKERFDTTYQMLRRRDYVKDLKKLPSEYFANLYLDTSGSKSLASLMCALEVVDPKHILFASDYPANQSLSDATGVVYRTDLSPVQQQDILGANLAKLLPR